MPEIREVVDNGAAEAGENDPRRNRMATIGLILKNCGSGPLGRQDAGPQVIKR